MQNQSISNKNSYLNNITFCLLKYAQADSICHLKKDWRLELLRFSLKSNESRSRRIYSDDEILDRMSLALYDIMKSHRMVQMVQYGDMLREWNSHDSSLASEIYTRLRYEILPVLRANQQEIIFDPLWNKLGFATLQMLYVNPKIERHKVIYAVRELLFKDADKLQSDERLEKQILYYLHDIFQDLLHKGDSFDELFAQVNAETRWAWRLHDRILDNFYHLMRGNQLTTFQEYWPSMCKFMLLNLELHPTYTRDDTVAVVWEEYDDLIAKIEDSAVLEQDLDENTNSLDDEEDVVEYVERGSQTSSSNGYPSSASTDSRSTLRPQ